MDSTLHLLCLNVSRLFYLIWSSILQGYFSIFAAKHHTRNKTHKQHQPLFDDPCVDL